MVESGQDTATDIQYLKGVGPKLAERLKKMGIRSIRDFAYTFPNSYDDRRQIPTISQLKKGDQSHVLGVVRSVTGGDDRRRPLKAVLQDPTGSVEAVWFNQAFLKKVILPGRKVLVKGKIDVSLYSAHPQCLAQETEIIAPQDQSTSLGKVLPVYPLVNGIYQSKMREISRQVMSTYVSRLEDPIPTPFLKEADVTSLADALTMIHFPKDRESYLRARKRLVFDEFLYQQLMVAMRRYRHRHEHQANPLMPNGPLQMAYRQALPYKLTHAQKKVVDDIHCDIKRDRAMNRLVQGDVGAGKTDVAILALLAALDTGYNAALLAPTEILVDQHFARLEKLVKPLGVTIIRIKGNMTAKTKRDVLASLTEATQTIVVGTHAIIEEKVHIPDLALTVIDEQHRFGVAQRTRLKQKGANPHSLYMTATPIPRSLSLTFYGDLDKSIIDELPPGRVPPQTMFFTHERMPKIVKFCSDQIQMGRQVYVVYPLVEESKKMDLKSAIEGYESLKEAGFQDYSVGLMHGRLKSDEKQAVMERFSANQTQVLVSTTVIEVGVDVPNATCMVIMNADRFGLSQLHQLRGRIGRGSEKSYCFLVGSPKGKSAKDRVNAMTKTNDGFEIAELDLKIRGPGDMLGTRQAGMPDLNMADLVRDEKILLSCKSIASKLIDADPDLQLPAHQALREALVTKPFWAAGMRGN